MLPAAPKTPKVPFAVVNTTMQQYEDGPRMPSDQAYAGGDLAFFSFEMAGYQKSEKDHIQLAWSWKCVDPAGVLLVEPASGKLDTDVSPEDKEWLPKTRQNFEIPFYAPTGTYHLLISIHDELAKADANVDVPFLIHGHKVTPGDALAVQATPIAFVVPDGT